MDSIFRQLEKAGKADVEHLTQWMKNSHVIKATETNSKARKVFQHVPNQYHVTLEEFKYILNEMAVRESKPVEQLTQQLADEGPMFIDAVIAGLNALKNAFNIPGPTSKHVTK